MVELLAEIDKTIQLPLTFDEIYHKIWLHCDNRTDNEEEQ